MIAARTRSRFLIAATVAACLGGATLDCAAAQTEPDYTRLLAAADRSDADRDADKRRDPTPFLAFAAPRSGMKVLDARAPAIPAN
jgi:predicted methyltransferase